MLFAWSQPWTGILLPVPSAQLGLPAPPCLAQGLLLMQTFVASSSGKSNWHFGGAYDQKYQVITGTNLAALLWLHPQSFRNSVLDPWDLVSFSFCSPVWHNFGWWVRTLEFLAQLSMGVSLSLHEHRGPGTCSQGTFSSQVCDSVSLWLFFLRVTGSSQRSEFPLRAKISWRKCWYTHKCCTLFSGN